MTIDAGFFKIIKSDCSSAFTSTLPTTCKPDTVFIDGQIKLMKADAVTSWSQFLNLQYYKTIEQSFGFGANVVVLAFDNYTYVPVSKGMTQANRSKHMPDVKFTERDSLPASMPDQWAAVMRNRTFKVKVIKYVLQCVKTWFEAKFEAAQVSGDATWMNRTLVLDFVDEPIVLGKNITNPITAELAVGRGECDIKAFNWLEESKRMMIYSTDGDYLPISLLQLQKHNKQCEILLYRIETSLPSMKKKKRVRDDQKLQSKFQKEFVHINTIYDWICTAVPSRKTSSINQFCCIIAMCGCDFAMNLPQLGPKRLWQIRHLFRNLDLTSNVFLTLAISLAYTHYFVQKNPPIPASDDGADNMPQCLAHLGNTLHKITLNTRNNRLVAQMWSSPRVCAHALNVLWVLQYWDLLQAHANPHASSWGYAIDAKGRTQFEAV